MSFLAHLAAQPLPPRAGEQLVIRVERLGLAVRASMPAAGAVFFTEVSGILASRMAREGEGEPMADAADVQRSTYQALLCATVDGLGPIDGAIEPCRLVATLNEATPAAQVAGLSASGEVPALWIWQVFDGMTAREVGDAIHAHAGEGRKLPPFVAPPPAS